MKALAEIARRLDLPDVLLEPCGRYPARSRLATLDRFPRRRGRLVPVTAMTPTRSGAGKTVNPIGLMQALVARGHRSGATVGMDY